MAIYTKTGDKGETSLYSKDKILRISKSAEIIEAIGLVDEANSLLGVSISFTQHSAIKKIILNLQKDMFTIGAILAGAKLRISKNKTKQLEKAIDQWEKELPVLKNFVLPGGEKSAAFVFYARTIIRKLERRLVTLSKGEKVNPELLRYINRLSDFLFVLGRKINKDTTTLEVIWKK